MNAPRRAALALSLACVLPAAGRAETGKTAAPFLQRQLGARASAMGGAFSAVRGDAGSVQYNPAALSTLARPEFGASYLSGFGDATHGLLVYAHPLRVGAIAASALYFDAGPVDLNFSNGTSRRVTAERDLAWSASYSLGLPLGLHAGASYRLLRLELAQTASASSSQFDLGVLWRLGEVVPGLSAGGAYQFLGPEIRFEQTADPPPRTLRYGVALHFPEADPRKLDPSVDVEAFDFTLALDQVSVLREKSSPRLGLELGITPHLAGRVAVRFGYVFNRFSESMTFGVGLRQGRVTLDYAFGGGDEDLGGLQQVSLGFRF